VAKPGAEKKSRKKARATQPDLPEMPPPLPPGTIRVLPMLLRIGDRLSDDRGEWEIVSRPHSTAGGRMVNARVRKPGGTTSGEERAWNAYERVMVIRASEEGKR
jgi:hypothetical protein